MKKFDWSKERIQEIVKDSDSLTEVLQKLGVPRQGNNTGTLRKKIEEYGIDISHFTYGAKKRKGVQKYIPASVYFTSDRTIHTSSLRTKLLLEGYKQNKCDCCGITEWNGKPLVMQMHHIDGNNNNNSFDNLQLLCPNCHSQTNNYRGLANKKKHYYCSVCGAEIKTKALRCMACAHKEHRKVSNRPTKEQLINDYIELKSFWQVGIRYGVSDNCIRKWFANVGLPQSSKEMQALIIQHNKQHKEYD